MNSRVKVNTANFTVSLIKFSVKRPTQMPHDMAVAGRRSHSNRFAEFFDSRILGYIVGWKLYTIFKNFCKAGCLKAKSSDRYFSPRRLEGKPTDFLWKRTRIPFQKFHRSDRGFHLQSVEAIEGLIHPRNPQNNVGVSFLKPHCNGKLL